MEKELLRKVQLTQLEIAKEIRRVCDENDIRYFLSDGTFLGAVRHQGFIPWDDDMDVGMLREDYEKFCRIAPEKLGKDYVFQNWYTDPNYGLPFGKVMKRGTIYLENKKTTRLRENGFYVDIFPYDYVPEAEAAQKEMAVKLRKLYRIQLMKCGYQPWMDNGKVNWKKRLGYLYYQLLALGKHQQELAKAYDAIATQYPESGVVCEQYGMFTPNLFHDAKIFREFGNYSFEGETFQSVRDYHGYLSRMYGDYMQLPPENERENRHQIVEIDFGK